MAIFVSVIYKKKFMEDEESTNKNKTNFNLSASISWTISTQIWYWMLHRQKWTSCMRYECVKIVFVKYTLVCCVPECIDFSWPHNTIMFPD